MSRNSITKKILEHPDREELINKLAIGISPNEINQFLKAKYSDISESKFVISENALKKFQSDYLDIYNFIQQDISKAKVATKTNAEDDLKLAVSSSPAYKDLVLKSANAELDIRQIVKGLCAAIETRFGQVFDEIQNDSRSINTRVDRLLIEYADSLANILEKYYKFTEEPTQTVQHNVSVQVVDSHVSILHDLIKEILSEIDLEASLLFMERFNEKMSKLKAPEVKSISSETRLVEAQLLSEKITKQINE